MTEQTATAIAQKLQPSIGDVIEDARREAYARGRRDGLEEAAKRWEEAHGFDKYGVAASIRALKD